MKEKFLKPEHKDYMDAVTFYNLYKLDDAINLFNSHHRKNNKGLYLFIEDGLTKKGEVIVKNGIFETKQHEVLKLPPFEKLTPFQVFLILQANKNVQAAMMEIERLYMDRDIPYIRVGVDYFKIIKKPDRYGIDREELKRWTKSELITDYGKKVCELTLKFDDFTIEPDNINYQPIIKNKTNVYRNLYNPFDHTPKEGEWKWTKVLLEHVFGNQYSQGIKYMQWLYRLPRQILPILVLGSVERETGKTTFINWCNQLFGANMTIINPSDLTSDFNGAYANCNVIAVEETMLDKDTSIEKLKSITTAKYISVNKKHIDHHKIPFFGKIIIGTNKPSKFARIDKEEIRFWIRVVGAIKESNLNIEEDLVKEIPAFLYYLQSIPMPKIKSRMGFAPDEIDNDDLQELKKESMPTLFKELVENLIDTFDKTNKDVIQMTLSDIKNIWFSHNHNYSKSYIKTILVDHFKLSKNPPSIRYIPVNGSNIGMKSTGRAYKFTRDIFENIEWNIDEKPPF